MAVQVTYEIFSENFSQIVDNYILQRWALANFFQVR